MGKKNDNNNNFDEKSDDTPIPTSPRALLRMGISPRGNNTNKYNYNMKNKRRDSHMMIGLPQGYRDSTHSKKDLENLSFKPPTAWPNGSNRSGRLDYEKLKGYN